MKILKLSTNWCMPCRTFGKTFHKVSEMEDYKDIEFKEIDIENDENGETLVEKYQVRSVPTTVLLNEDDELICKISGNISEQNFIDIINNAMKMSQI